MSCGTHLGNNIGYFLCGIMFYAVLRMIITHGKNE